MAESNPSGTRSLILPAVLDLAGAEPLLLTLRDLLSHEKPVTLDGSQVERVSTACLQVLVAACHAARAHHLSYALETPSPILTAAMRDLGLAPALLGALPA